MSSLYCATCPSHQHPSPHLLTGLSLSLLPLFGLLSTLQLEWSLHSANLVVFHSCLESCGASHSSWIKPPFFTSWSLHWLGSCLPPRPLWSWLSCLSSHTRASGHFLNTWSRSSLPQCLCTFFLSVTINICPPTFTTTRFV